MCFLHNGFHHQTFNLIKEFQFVFTLFTFYYFDNIKPKPPRPEEKKTGWVCKICGYIYEGEELPADFICPLCKHPASDFEKVTL